MYDFKSKNTLEKRATESINIMSKYPDRLPVIVEKHHTCTLPNIDKCKYLVPKDLTMGQFIYVIRKRIKLEPSQSLFISVKHSMVPSSKTLFDIYNSNKDEDGFLYIVYTNENTFG